MKYILLCILIINGCGTYNDTDGKYNPFCDRQPDSVSCTQQPSTNLIPTYERIYSAQFEMYDNFTYITDREKYGTEDYWFDGEVSNIKLEGDCEDISLTFISQLILDGYNPANIKLMFSGIDGIISHAYAVILLASGELFNFYRDDTLSDIEYMQYDNIGVFVKSNSRKSTLY